MNETKIATRGSIVELTEKTSDLSDIALTCFSSRSALVVRTDNAQKPPEANDRGKEGHARDPQSAGAENLSAGELNCS